MSAPVVPPSSAPPDWLPRLLEQLVSVPTGDADQPEVTALIRFELSGDGGVDFGTKLLAPGEHPVGSLLGFVAPDEWFAFGVIAPGWGSRSSAGGARAQFDGVRNRTFERPSRAADRRRTRTAHVVARDGTEAAALHIDGEDTHGYGLFRATDGDALTGAVPDLLRRVMGVPTAPPGFPPSELLSAVWLTFVVGHAADSGRARLRWDDVLAASPACLEGASLAAAHPEAITWSTLRWAAIDGAEMFGVDPTLAAWFDDGAFARWSVCNYLPVEALLPRVRAVTTSSAYRRVRQLLREWGQLP